MYRVIKGKTDLPDARDFIDLLNSLDQHPLAAVRQLFDFRKELIVTRAPGRLDVMGGIADYSGSLVLELPIGEATFVALQWDPDSRLRIVSLSDDSGQGPAFEMSFEDFFRGGEPLPYDVAREYFQRDPERRWAAYVAGVFLVLMRERDIQFRHGARILISSNVPVGKGVSSSAALEVAVMQAVSVAFGICLSARELAMLCQKVENLVVGAPCGIMDQMTSACGEADRLLAILCQPAEIQGSIQVPEPILLCGVDSGIRHSVAGADYGSVRVGAFMGYRIIAELAGLRVEQSTPGASVVIDDPRWGGFLVNISPAEFERDYLQQLPERLSGTEFLKRYTGITDPVTHVDPQRSYAVRVPTSHPIYEHQRVRDFSELIRDGVSSTSATPSLDVDRSSTKERGNDELLGRLGQLMYESHNSYSACGLNSDGTDLLVELIRAAGPDTGLYGAKITGGGSGGTVAVIGNRQARSAISAVRQKYFKESGREAHIFDGSSPGSSAFGHILLQSTE
jgi:L-arabinokinase